VKRVAHAIWNSPAVWAAVARSVLVPASMAYRGVTSVRNALYDRGTLSVARSSIPVVSIGNLAVGGTGKTPVAAWMASQLGARGARPAIVMRGYGDDEPRVHALMNPGIPVVVNADRFAAVRDAAAAGCDVAILDDGFQHRRLARLEDVVLVSADRWREPVRLLPAGPWREAPSALSRATMVMVTRKAGDRADAHALMQRLASLTSTSAGAVAVLELDALHDAVTGAVRPLSDIRGTTVLVAAGIGDPDSLAAQLRLAGARVEMRSFPDHHVYDSSDIARLAQGASGVDHMLCTLKDGVKLGPRWPREAPTLWYVSLRCRIEVGGAEVAALLDRVNAARQSQIK
jgi:tetraacyldisaccharide 4'-kinase